MSLDEASLIADVRSRLFAPSPDPAALTIGAELELMAVETSTHAPVSIIANQGPSLASCVERATSVAGWREQFLESGAPSWILSDGTRISFEPGGQIEISSRPYASCSELIASLQNTVHALEASASEEGIKFVALGVDPYNDISAVPLQLHSERYDQMTRYLSARGEFGPRMMRQTAALQMNVEHGPRPLKRWRLLNALAPYVVALFANSRRYAGRATGHESYRGHFWRRLDPSRTGLPCDGGDPPARYAAFALDAGAIRAARSTGEFHTFRSLLAESRLTADDWHFHLSTLFPEVRPKEYFELRSADTISAEHLAAPLAFVTGLVYDDRSADDASIVLGEPNENLLEIAGRDGLRNQRIRATAAELVSMSMSGAKRLGDAYLTTAHIAQASDWLTARVRAK